MRKFLDLFVQTFFGWNERKASVYAAAIAYSTLFSLAPLLIISMNLASLTFNAATFEARLLETIERQAGPEVAQLTQEILSARFNFQPSGSATLVSVGLLLFGASGVFRQLRTALNAMWNIEARPSGMKRTLFGIARGYLLSTSAALLLGLAPIVLLFASTMVASVPSTTVVKLYPTPWLTTIIQVFASPAFYFVVFALVLKYLPQANAAWRAIWPGALLSAAGYWIGSVVLGWYVQNAAIRSIYGAAGSALALLIWAYYSAFIFLYGARFVLVVARTYHFLITPDKDCFFIRLSFDSEDLDHNV